MIILLIFLAVLLFNAGYYLRKLEDEREFRRRLRL